MKIVHATFTIWSMNEYFFHSIVSVNGKLITLAIQTGDKFGYFKLMQQLL